MSQQIRQKLPSLGSNLATPLFENASMPKVRQPPRPEPQKIPPRTGVLTSMCNKDTPKHETRVPCVGRVLTRHGRLKSALRHAILVGCGRCFTLSPNRRFFA